MQPVYVLTIIMLYAAFGCMFLFVSRQHPGKFARLLAQGWLLEAFRACIVLMELNHASGSVSHWHSLSDCLNLLATWWLFAACADLAGVKLPARLGPLYLGIGVPVILLLRYAVPGWLVAGGLTPQRADFVSVFIELTLIFTTVTIARLMMLAWLIGLWRRTRMPGAMLAIIFGVPYIVFAVAVPVQFFYGYYPEWVYLTWSLRVLGFSLGMILLLFDRQMAAMRSSEARLRRFIDSNIQGVMVCDFMGTITAANDAFLNIVGYSRAELEAGQLNWQRLTPPEWAPLDQRAVTELTQHGVCAPWEKEYFHKDGSRVSVLIGVAMLDGIAETEGRECVAFVLDLSANKKAEERIRHLANFPELNPNPVLEFDAAGRVAYENPAAEAMATKLARGQREQLLPRESATIVRQCLASGQPRLRVITTHGKTTLSWSFYPIISQQVVHCYIGDITERTQLEEQLRQAQKMEAIGQLAGGVAHDFNNLLTAIIGHLGLLQSGRQVPPDMAESLQEISHAANRASNLTGQLLAFSRLQVINMRPVDLNEVIGQLAKMLRRLLGEDIAMQLDFASERLFFNGDASMVDQVVINLAVNARDAMPGGGTLRISTGREVRPAAAVREAQADGSRAGSFVCLTISDTGSGIPADVLPKIFDPFFTTKEVGKGTGLGLATAFGIVKQHHGWIEVDSEPGHGTTFRIYLPRLASPEPENPEPRPATTADRGRGEVILLVEDEPAVREIGVRALTGNGYRVLSAASGQAALALWEEHREEITLLYTDLIMPGGISGLQLARRLLDERPGLRVIYTSGYSREIAGREIALEDSVNYLAKPYELEDLFRTVRAALDGGGQTRNPFGVR